MTMRSLRCSALARQPQSELDEHLAHVAIRLLEDRGALGLALFRKRARDVARREIAPPAQQAKRDKIEERPKAVERGQRQAAQRAEDEDHRSAARQRRVFRCSSSHARKSRVSVDDFSRPGQFGAGHAPIALSSPLDGVSLWCVTLAASEDEFARIADWLAAAEHARAARFGREYLAAATSSAARRCAGHSAARSALAPAAVPIVRGDRGRPRLDGDCWDRLQRLAHRRRRADRHRA